MKSSSAAVTLSQLADLVATDRSALCRNPRLPQATPVHSATPGRPEHAIALDTLAAHAFDATSHLTEAECRLRLWLAGRTEPRRLRIKNGKVGPFYLIENPDGTFAMRQLLCPADLTFDQQCDLRAAIHGEQP